VLAVALGDAAGPAGTALVVVLAGACLARRLPAPLEALCAHHLDDVEITRLGPGRSVARLPWAEVVSCVQGPQALVVAGPTLRMTLPLAGLVRSAGWAGVLARVVPARALALWKALDGSAVVLTPAVDPGPGRIAAWCWLPALAAAFASGALALAVVAAALAGVERGV
jgi:hypothetical protein